MEKKNKKMNDWLNQITEQTFKKLQRMTFSKSRGDVIACNIFLMNNNLVCVNQIMTVSVIALHNENDLN